MIFTKIIFLLVMFFFADLNTKYVGYWPAWLFILTALGGIILFVKVKLQGSKVDIKLMGPRSMIDQGNKLRAGARVNNNSSLAVVNARIYARYCGYESEKMNKKKVEFSVESKSHTDIVFNIDTEHTGKAEVKIDKCFIYDDMQLFGKRIKCDTETRKFYILPKYYENIGFDVNSLDDDFFESDLYSDKEPGDDGSETFQIREYEPGDKSNRIHWKLSSKSQEMMVRDFSKPISNGDVLVVENNLEVGYERDKMHQALLSLMYRLLQDERIFTVSFQTADNIENVVVKGYEGVEEVFKALYESPINKTVLAMDVLMPELEEKISGDIYWFVDELDATKALEVSESIEVSVLFNKCNVQELVPDGKSRYIEIGKWLITNE